ncbi:MAG: alpha/beta fold hydrolase, partial [Cyanobium sp.]
RRAVLVFLDDVIARSPATPCFLVGHSMGGTVVLDLALAEPEALRRLGVRGLILSNPALGPGGVARWRLLVARLLSRLWPGFSLRTGLAEAAASRDPQVLAWRAADPWRHDRCSARLGSEFLATAAQLGRTAPRLALPLLMLQSGADRITPGTEARHFFAAAGSADKTWRDYPGSYHELYDDLDREQVFTDLLAWLADHGCPARPPRAPTEAGRPTPRADVGES